MEILSVVISLIALGITGANAWFTWWNKGKVLMTQPTSIVFFKNASVTKIHFRMLLYSTAHKGKVLESLYITLDRGETRQNFNTWLYGTQNDLVRGSGLFIPYDGVNISHAFFLPRDGSEFHFLPGDYEVKIFAKLVNQKKVKRLSAISLSISNEQSEKLETEGAELHFDWGPGQANYYSHLEKPTGLPKVSLVNN